MRLCGGLLAAVVAATLSVGGSTVLADQGEKKKKAAAHAVHGTVVKVDAGQNGNGTITVKVAGKKAKGKAKAAAAGERTIKVTANTKFEVLGKKKGAAPAAFAQLKAGDHVVVTVTGGTAQKVQIAAKGKKAKKAAAPVLI